MAKKFSYEEIKQFIESESDCKLLSDQYLDCKQKLLLRCKCGNIFEKTFSDFKHQNQRKCKKCSKHEPHTYQSVKYFIEVESGSGCKLLSEEYKNYKSKLKIRCKCGNIFQTSFDAFRNKQKRQCNSCTYEKLANERKLSIVEVKQYIESENYKLISEEFINVHEKIKLECPEGHLFFTTYNRFKVLGNRCPYCSNIKSSKGIKIIQEILENNKIPFEIEKTFKECKSKNNKKLRFDFFVNNKLLIEFDGGQHFEYINSWGGEEEFKQRKKNDEIKNQFCIKNNIPLLRIPYWEIDNIEYILINALKYFELIDAIDNYDVDIVEKYLVDNDWNHDDYVKLRK